MSLQRVLPQLDRVLDSGLVFLLVFPVVTYGAVQEWSESIGQSVVLLIVAAWLLKATWAEPPVWEAPETRGAGSPRSWLGGRLLRTGIELPALLFTALIVVQMIPLPATIVRLVSPRTAEIYASSLPGYGEPGNPSFRDLPRWLQRDSDATASEIPALPPDPDAVAAAVPAETFDVSHPALRPLSITPSATRWALEKWLAYLAVFLVAFHRLARVQLARRYLVLLAGLSGLIGLAWILQDITTAGASSWWRFGSSGEFAFGLFVSRNNFAGWLEMLLPISACLMAQAWERHRLSDDARTLPAVILLLFLTLLGLAAFVVAQSRGGVLALGGALAIYAIVRWIQRRPKPAVVAVVIVMLAIGLAFAFWIGGEEMLARYETLGGPGGEPSFHFRVAATLRTLSMATDFPVAGTGLGTFEESFYLYSPGTSYQRLSRAHNDYAQIASETGLIGALAVLWGLLVLLRRGLIPALRARGKGAGWLLHGVAVGLLAVLLHELVDFNLQIYGNGILFAFLCGFLLRHAPAAPR